MHIVFLKWTAIILLGKVKTQINHKDIRIFSHHKMIIVYLIDICKVEGLGWGDRKYITSPNLSFIYSDMSIYFYK